jgi:hypothetical protein
MDFVRDVYQHQHHLLNLGEPNRVVFPLINMTMKIVRIRFVGKLYKNHTLHDWRHSYKIVVRKYVLENTPDNNATGKHFFMTCGYKETIARFFIRPQAHPQVFQFTRHDFENLSISPAVLFLSQT